MADLTFHILDCFAQDLVIEEETETTREVSFDDAWADDDDGPRARRSAKARRAAGAAKPREMVVHLFGATAEGKPVRANVLGFRPFFFVRLPDDTSDTRNLFRSKVERACPVADITFCKRKTLFGFTGGALFPFARIAVPSKSAFYTAKKLFLNADNMPIFSLGAAAPSLEVFEANLDPMLRFFHLRNLQPAGWATIAGADGEEGPDGTLEVSCDWEEISLCTKPPAASAAFLIASWDIECYSQTGEFPLAKRGYDRIAKLLLQSGKTARECAEVLIAAAMYPDAPPPGMDPIRSRSGTLPNRDKLDTLLHGSGFLDELTTALESRESGAVLAALKPLARMIPLAGDPVIQIGVVLQRGQTAPTRHVFVLGTCSPIADATVHSYKTETDMILGWAKFMRAENPDVLIGYNVFGFDEKYLWERICELGLVTEETEDGRTETVCQEDLHTLTRLFDQKKDFKLETKFLSSSALGDNTMYMWSTHGRLQVDLFHYIKPRYQFTSYKLDDVCTQFMSGKLGGVETPVDGPWILRTKATSDVVAGRYVTILDETGDAVVEKMRVLEVRPGTALVVEGPDGDDAADLAIAAATAVKWAVVKDDVPPQEIFRLHRGSAADRARVAAYCIQDCVLVLDLYKKLDVFNNAMAMANACSVPVGYIFTRGQGVKIESLIYKECYERNETIVVLPNPPQRDGPAAAGAAAEESYEGAIVLDPTPGFYFDSPVGVADFASLYPSTIISENISYDTLAWVKDYNLDGSFRCLAFGSDACEAAAAPDVRWTDIQFDIWGFDPADKRKHPAKLKTGIRICRYAQYPGNAKGALPEIVSKLLAARKTKRKEADKETDPFRKALLDAEQLAYKLTANSLYGQLGSGTFKIRLQHLAASVTAYGRKQIMFAKDAIEEFYGPAAGRADCCAETVYGDTDSLFINFNVRNPETGEGLKGREALVKTMELTEEAGKFVTKMLKPPHDFEYDKVFAPFIIFSKKRYVGNKYEASPDDYYQTSMGIATKRRDYAAIVKVIYGGALRILLTDKDIAGAIQFVKEKLLEFVNGKMSLNLITMSKSLRAEYKSETPPAHKILAQRMAARDPGNAPASGDRIPFIYVLPPTGQAAAKLQGDRIETPTYIRAKGLKPDYKFYIEHQLMSPLMQLFGLVAEKIPGIRVPSKGWAAATESDREAVVEEALFADAFRTCDKGATSRFMSLLGGSAGPVVAAVAVPKPPRPTAAAASAAPKKPAQVQQKMSYFMNKMIIKGMEKATKAASRSPPATRSRTAAASRTVKE